MIPNTQSVRVDEPDQLTLRAASARTRGAARTGDRRGARRGFANPLIYLCEYRGGRKVGITLIGAQQAPAARAKNPALQTCRPEPVRAQPARPEINQLLDASNDGTFANARRAAILGHQDAQLVTDSLGRLFRASEEGRIDPDFAARRAAEITDQPLAAAQAELARPALTPEQLAAQRRARQNGSSSSDLLAAQIAKLQEACRPQICYLTGNKRTGIADSINWGRLDPVEVSRAPNFLRFCTEEDLKRTQPPADGWGDWLVTIVRGRNELPGAVVPSVRRQLVLGGPQITTTPVEGAPAATTVEAPTLEYLCFYTIDTRTGKIVAKNSGWNTREAILARADFGGFC